MRKTIQWLLLALILLLPAGAVAASAGSANFTVTKADASSADVEERITVYKSTDNQRYLFLPAGWDGWPLRVWLNTKKETTLNGIPVASGDTASCLIPGTTVTVGYGGGKTYKLTILQENTLPSVFINTKSGSLKKIESHRGAEETGSIVINDSTGQQVTAQPLTQMRGHGNSSFTSFKKKSYQFKLEKKQNLFGMGKSKTWLLISSYRDRSFLRNVITSDLAAYAGLEYSPEMVHVNLYVNGEYRGLYLLSEKVQVSSSRVAIDDLSDQTQAVNDKELSTYPQVGKDNAVSTKRGSGRYYSIPKDPADITGGYLVELEWYSPPFARGGTAYRTKRDMYIYLKSPKYCTKAEYTYITGIAQSLQDAIFARDGIDPATGKHFSQIIDVNSLVLKLTLEEVIKNYDANRTSQFFYKPADEVSPLLKAGPVWDYDSSYGCYAIEKHPDSTLPTGLYVVTGKGLPKADSRFWYPAFYQHSEVKQGIKQAYQSLYRQGISILLGETTDPSGHMRSLDEYAQGITAAAEMDSIRWPYSDIEPNIAQTGTNLPESITFLKQWLTDRRAFLDEALAGN